MTESGFASTCAATLAQACEAVKNNGDLSLAAVQLSRCLQCQGDEKPPELQVVDLEILKTERGSMQPEKELKMSEKKQDGTCENCGRKNMSLTRLHGDLVCASCSNLFIDLLANRPEVVEKALRKMLPHLLTAAASGSEKEQELTQRCDELVTEVQSLGDKLAGEQELWKKRDADAERYWSFLLEIGETLHSGFDAADNIAQVPVMVRETMSGLQADKAGYQQQAEQLADENTALVNRISELENRLDAMEPWQAVPAAEGLLENGYERNLIRDQLADFALKVLQGRVGIVHREG